jgi:hypothetical protein
MRIGSRGVLAVLAAASLSVAACSSTPAASTAPSEAAPSTAPSAAESAAAPSAAGLPYTATLKDGSTFTLAPRIADKLKSGEKLNYLFSYQS